MIGQPLGNAVATSGSVTGPGAGVAIATIASGSLPAGTYHILAQVNYGTVAGVLNDMQLQAGATVLYIFQIGATVNTNGTLILETVRILNGSTALTVNAIAGAALAIYQASIVATPIRGA